LRGELLRAQQEATRRTKRAGQPVRGETEVESCFQQAVAMARSRSAKSLELRAATSLARLRQQQGRSVEDHKLLSEVYSWFTEGFDTKDLQEAKALLEELS
jgi:predicted ATPase